MKALKIILNIFGVLLAIVFSFITFFMLLITPVISTGSTLLQAETLHKVINEWDLSERIGTHLKDSASESHALIAPQLLDGLMESQLVNDLLDLYLNNLLNIVEQDQIASITQKDIDMLLEKNMPDLINRIRPYIPKELGLTDEDIAPYVIQILSPYLMELTKTLPTLDDLGLDPTIIKVIHMLYNKTLLKYAYLVVILGSVLILLCRIPRFKGLIWITVVYALAAILLLPSSGFLTSFIKSIISQEGLSELEFIINPFIQIAQTNMTKIGIIYIIVAVLSLVIYIISGIVRKSATGSKHTLAA